MKPLVNLLHWHVLCCVRFLWIHCQFLDVWPRWKCGYFPGESQPILHFAIDWNEYSMRMVQCAHSSGSHTLQHSHPWCRSAHHVVSIFIYVNLPRFSDNLRFKNSASPLGVHIAHVAWFFDITLFLCVFEHFKFIPENCQIGAHTHTRTRK